VRQPTSFAREPVSLTDEAPLSPATKPRRLSLGGLFRFSFAGALLTYTFWRANPRDVWDVCTHAAMAPLLVAVALVLVDRALMAYRWFVLLRPLEGRTLPPFQTILRIFFVSTFVGTFLPASIGGDAVRAYSLANHRVPIADATASVVLDRMLGVLSVLLMALLGLALARDLAASRAVMLALGVTSLACVVAAVLIFSDAADRLAERMISKLPWARARRGASSLFAAIRRYSTHHWALANVLAGSVAVQTLRVIQAYYLGTSIGMRQPLVTYFAFVPLILLIMFLPITANGIGTGQAAFLWLFSRVGTPRDESFALSVLFVALGIVGNLPGAAYYLRGDPRKAAAESTQ
jgi:glycosyltransferase 2 family protein